MPLDNLPIFLYFVEAPVLTFTVAVVFPVPQLAACAGVVTPNVIIIAPRIATVFVNFLNINSPLDFNLLRKPIFK